MLLVKVQLQLTRLGERETAASRRLCHCSCLRRQLSSRGRTLSQLGSLHAGECRSFHLCCPRREGAARALCCRSLEGGKPCLRLPSNIPRRSRTLSRLPRGGKRER